MNLLATTLTLTSLLATALSAPTSSPLIPRAGAPIAQPIDNCNLTMVFPTFHLENCSFVPSDNFASTNVLYSYRLNEEMPLGDDPLEYCMETCHGYGNLNECQSVFFDYSPTNVLCTLFSKPLAQTDLVKAEMVNEVDSMALAVGITCPASPVAAALPAPTSSPLVERAGAPIPKPVDNCNLTSIFPTFPNWGLGFVPSVSFMSTNLLSSYVLNEDYQLVFSEEVLLEDCLKTCHGYGDLNECQSVYFVYLSFPVGTSDAAQGTEEPEGEQAGCLMFSKPLAESDMVEPSVDMTYRSVKAVDITCPDS